MSPNRIKKHVESILLDRKTNQASKASKCRSIWQNTTEDVRKRLDTQTRFNLMFWGSLADYTTEKPRNERSNAGAGSVAQLERTDRQMQLELRLP